MVKKEFKEENSFNNKQTVLSIIVPIYNAEKHLKRCIESIINQEYYFIELILINDGSIDKSGVICDEYAKRDNRIKVVHKKNGGVNTARNTGLDIATGKYVTFVDADDEITQNTFALNMELLNKDDNIDILQYPEIGIHGKNEKMWYNYPQQMQIIKGTRNMVYALLSEKNIIPGGLWGKLYKRHIYDELRLRTDLHFCEDMIMLPKIFEKANKFLISTVGGYRYIWNDDSACHSEYTQAKCLDVARSAFGLYQICLEYQVNVLNYWNNAVKACINAWSFCGPTHELKVFLKELKRNKEGMSSKMQVQRMVKLARIVSPLNAAWIKWALVRLFHLNKV